ncbi:MULTISPECIES: WxL protein peptidoglycan domain-containing protein [unclassified Streptomyces]|uniref:WxL protein peptidoglycan domain-containing protein n=1 Tax=unclassified Streptomyces TaxID=2593676 RepID=UPI002E362656|nr:MULTISPECIES: DUF916 domain-containing protein [unclassified Streptomyces]WUC66398.1 DUF916 domain-containing protein [Streptomyces sp. NBC_00539]
MRPRTPSPCAPSPCARLLALLLALLLPVAPLLLGVPAASAADNGTWGVFPTPPPGAAMTERAYFFHQGAAGSTLSDSVTILNSSDKELTFRVFAADAVNTPVGGAFALLPVETEPKDVGAWTTLPPGTAPTVTVPPKGRKDVPFTVKVPEDAAPGDHVGGIVALNTAVEGIRQDGKVQVGVKRSVGARLYVRVAGPVAAGLSVEDVRVSRDAPLLPWVHSASAKVSYSLVNRGNVVVGPRVTLSAQGLFGRTVLDRPARDLKLTLLPGQRIELTEAWPDAPQADRVRVRVEAGASAYPDLRSRAGTDFIAVPWPAVGALLLLSAAALTVRVLRRRRAGPRPERGSPPA